MMAKTYSENLRQYNSAQGMRFASTHIMYTISSSQAYLQFPSASEPRIAN